MKKTQNSFNFSFRIESTIIQLRRQYSIEQDYVFFEKVLVINKIPIKIVAIFER